MMPQAVCFLPSSVLLKSDSSIHLGLVLDCQCCGNREFVGLGCEFFLLRIQRNFWIDLLNRAGYDLLTAQNTACSLGRNLHALASPYPSPLLVIFCIKPSCSERDLLLIVITHNVNAYSFTHIPQINAGMLGHDYFSCCRFHSYIEDCRSITSSWYLCNIFC